MITTLRSRCGLEWELKIETNEGYGNIMSSNLRETFSGNDDICDHEEGVIDGIEGMVLSLVSAGIEGFEDKISHAIDCELETLANMH